MYKSKKKKLTIIRHSRTDYNDRNIIQGHLDIPLNKAGMEEATKIAQAV